MHARDPILHPPAPARVRTWQDGPTAVPTGTARVFGPSSGTHLTLAAFPPDYEYARALRHPHLYDERDLDAMHECWLATHGLTGWECRCGHTNHTPDAAFSTATPCARCGEA